MTTIPAYNCLGGICYHIYMTVTPNKWTHMHIILGFRILGIQTSLALLL